MGTVINETDGRVLRTKQAIREAMVRLLQTHDLDKVSITLLCKEANVSRTTFYHYYAIPEDCYNEIMEDLLKQIDRESREADADTIACMQHFLDVVKKNQRLFKIAYGTGFYNSPIQKSFQYNVQYVKEHSAGWKDISEEYLSFCNYGMFGLVSEWLQKGCPGQGEGIISFYRELLEERGLV